MSTLRPWELSRRAENPAEDRSPASLAPLGLPAERPSLADLEAAVVDQETSGEVDVEGRLLWGAALMAEGGFDDAMAAFEPALAAPDASGRLHVLAAIAAHSAGQSPTDARLAALDEALRRGPDGEIAALWMTAGGLFVRAGQLDQAASAFDRAVTAYGRDSDAPGLVWALREAVQVASHRGRTDEAMALLQRAQRFAPHDELRVLLRLDEARLAGLGGAWADCRRALEAALDLGERCLPPDHPLIDHTLVSLAAARMELDETSDETERMLERALGMRRARGTDSDAATVQALLLLGEHHRLRRRLDDALPLLGRAATARETNGEPPQAAAHAYLVWSRALEDKGLPGAAADKRARAEALLGT